MITNARFLLTVSAVVLAAAPALTETDYPTRTVTLIVPFGAGGGTDNLARTFLPAFQEALGGTVVIENRPGGGSTIGTEAAVRAAPDGYTVLLTDTAIMVNPALYDNLPYNTLEDLEPVSMIATGPVLLVAHPDAEADTLGDLIELARERPGQLPFASGGHGASTHLALELMQLETNTEVVHIPYGGSGPATTDLVAGHVQYMFNGISASRPHLDAGALKAIAVTSDERHPAVPDVPTFAEEGFPGVNPMSIWGAWVPVGTPEPIIEKLSGALAEAVGDPKVDASLGELGFLTVGSSPAEYGERVVTEMERWAEVIEAAGIEVD
jgi:tripartite-type tricarboxylate transporter receptor subunit TctC